ncbi:MAG: glutamyl-tRNA amidotransferase [Rhodospirillaceae bacterium]|nr:glutamyl-tRNA amidotransferase [Rhodospirillaceae bacterium]|tara:strand:+ start:77 stop:535 length:459 start_codon:yes stop_codon:yes gene_type:complete
MLRQQLNDALKEAMKAQQSRAVSTLRLILAALKDRDIANRTEDADDGGISDDQILQLLQSMIKQRRDSIEAYLKGGRQELADGEAEEIDIIQRFLPDQMDDKELAEVVEQVIAETGASSIKDMGNVMGMLRGKFAGQMDFGKASALVKARLG